MVSVTLSPRVVKAGLDGPMDTQLILFIGAHPFEVLYLESFIRLKRWDGHVIDVLVMPDGRGVCSAPECRTCNLFMGPTCVHVEALQLHGLLRRVPVKPTPTPPRPVIVPESNGKAVAREGHHR